MTSETEKHTSTESSNDDEPLGRPVPRFEDGLRQVDVPAHVQALRNVRKHWLTALIVAVGVFAVATFYTLGAKRIYQAKSVLRLDPNPPSALGQDIQSVVDIGVGQYWNNQEYYQTQHEIITSQRIARDTVKQLGLHRDPAFILDLPPGAQRADQPLEVSEDDAASILRGRLEVAPVKDSQLVTVRYRDADSERSARVLNTLVDVYIEHNLTNAYASTDRAISELSGQLGKLDKDLRSSEQELYNFKKDHGILSVALDDRSNMLRSEMQLYNDELARVKAEQQAAAARYSVLKSAATDVSKLPAKELLSSEVLKSLRSKYLESVREREALMASGKGPKHPDVIAAATMAEETKRSLLQEVRNIKASTRGELRVLSRRAGGLKSLYDDAKRRALELNELQIEYRRLDRRESNLEELHQLVLKRTKESGLSRTTLMNNISVIDPARVPKGPIWPRVPLNLAAGLLLGLVLGVGSAIARGMLDRSLKTPEEIETELGLTTLGLLPTIDPAGLDATYDGKRRKRRQSTAELRPELVIHDHPKSSVAEAVRALRTNLTFMSPDEPFKTVLLTSAGPAEGKTTVACCIAAAMAQAGNKTVIIDCDLRRARIHKVFGATMDEGLTSAVLEGSIVGAVKETEVPNLHVLPAGPLPPNPAELLHSKRFREMLSELNRTYDRIVIDSPPVVAVTDAAVLSTMVDATLVVVRAHATPRDGARHAIRSLRKVGTPVTGVVLNAVDLTRHEYRSSQYRYVQSYYGEAT